MKISSTPLDPFGLWAGPWFFVGLGLQFVRSWQEACYSRLRLDGAFKPFTLPVPSGSARFPFGRIGDERSALEAQIAARQGRELPRLGCLTGVRVVGGPESEPVPVPRAAPARRVEGTPEKASVKGAAKLAEKAPEKSVQKASERAPARPAPKAVAKVVDEKPPAAEAAEESPAVPPAGSVTSMLALQARSLSKAVARAPKVEVPGKVSPVKSSPAKKAAAKPASKAAAKPVSKSVEKSVAKSVANAASAPAAKGAPKKATPKRATPAKPAAKPSSKPGSKKA